MSKVFSSSSKASALIGLAMLVGGAGVSSADTIVQSQTFGPIADSFTQKHVYALFDPALGTLTRVEYALTSTIFDKLGVTVSANLVFESGDSSGFNGQIMTLFPVEFDAGNPLQPPSAYTGISTFFALLSYSSNCAHDCGSGWSGQLDITYTYTPNPSAVPLPAAAPLFATGVGALAVLGWRRKRKTANQ